MSSIEVGIIIEVVESERVTTHCRPCLVYVYYQYELNIILSGDATRCCWTELDWMRLLTFSRVMHGRRGRVKRTNWLQIGQFNVRTRRLTCGTWNILI